VDGRQLNRFTRILLDGRQSVTGKACGCGRCRGREALKNNNAFTFSKGIPMQNAATTSVNPQDKTVAILVHIGGLFFSWLAPLVIYLIKKGSGDDYTAHHAREALNFQLTLLVAYFACFILSFVLIGLFLFWVAMLTNLILSIMAAVKASNGVDYRYPMTIRFVKG
jgi:uncharacterized Tic20 family protein